VSTVTQSYDTSAVLPQVLLAEVRQQPQSRFEVSTIFRLSFVCQISCSDSWLDRTFQATAQTIFYIKLQANCLKFPA